MNGARVVKVFEMMAGIGLALMLAMGCSPAGPSLPLLGTTAPPRTQAMQPPSPAIPQNRPSSSVGPVAVEVVEQLRLRVPKQGRQAWLQAERASWDPWLQRQQGFLGRELYWDAQRQEGVLLIRWASRADWDAIPKAEIERVQESFVLVARQALGQANGNPFPLLQSGALEPMGRS